MTPRPESKTVDQALERLEKNCDDLTTALQDSQQALTSIRRRVAKVLPAIQDTLAVPGLPASVYRPLREFLRG